MKTTGTTGGTKPMRHRSLTVIALISVGLLTGCSDDDADPAATTNAPAVSEAAGEPSAPSTTTSRVESAEDAIRRQFGYISAGQHGRMYDELHPDHQAVIDRALYMRCASEGAAGFTITDVNVVDQYDESIDILGQQVPATAVTVEFTATKGAITDTDTDTFHEVMIDGRWVWTSSQVADYSAGVCPT